MRATSRWRWPPESSRPLLADQRVEPVGERGDPVVDPRAAERVLELVVGRVGPREARFSRIVELKRCAFWPATANVRADVLLAVVAQVAARDRDAALPRGRGSAAAGS